MFAVVSDILFKKCLRGLNPEKGEGGDVEVFFVCVYGCFFLVFWCRWFFLGRLKSGFDSAFYLFFLKIEIFFRISFNYEGF